MHKKSGDGLIIVSAVAAIISGYVSITQTDVLNLAGTQWMLIAIALGIYAIYAKIRMV